MRALRRPARLTAAIAAVALLAACSGDGDDDAAPEEDGGTSAVVDDDAQDLVTGATPDDDLPPLDGTSAVPDDDATTGDATTSAEPSGDVPTSAQVPPLLAVIDGWPETEVTFPDADVTFVSKVADDTDRRQQGLMNVEDLPADVGMLFLFEEERTGGFWMKDTLVPLDIAYLADGEVVSILQMEPCEADPCPSYDPDVAYDAALEVNLGTFEEAGIEVGDPVTWTDPREVAR